jgi:hypothetical protein
MRELRGIRTRLRRACLDGRLGGLAILLALLPNLLYLGHWKTAEGHEHAKPSQQTEHERHCHGESEGCSDVPAQTSVPFDEAHMAVARLNDEQPAEVPELTLQGSQHSSAPDVPPPNPSSL